MRVLFVTPECAPLTKTGGLGDVSAALPAALRAQGNDVRVLLPRYREIDPAGAEERAQLRLLGMDVRVLEKGDCLLVDAPALYDRDGNPYQDAAGVDWPDNALRFGLLSRVAALLAGSASPLAWRPEVLHCNDWPTALAPVYLHFEPARSGTVMTVHNLAFQGIFDAALLERLELPRATFAIEGVEFYGRLSFLKGGLVYADAISTVSPTYAREILTEELGCGLDGVLRERRGVLRGILNGVDGEIWNPMTDPHIAERYSWTSLERKAANKLALQSRLNLAPEPQAPLLGMVGRFTHRRASISSRAPWTSSCSSALKFVSSGTASTSMKRRFPRRPHAIQGASPARSASTRSSHTSSRRAPTCSSCPRASSPVVSTRCTASATARRRWRAPPAGSSIRSWTARRDFCSRRRRAPR